MRGGTVAKNAVALHAQNGAAITESDGTGDLGVGEIRISSTTRFVDNETRVGNGILALPQPPIQ